jgi:hypothetical protein
MKSQWKSPNYGEREADARIGAQSMFRVLFVHDLLRLGQHGVLWTLWRLIFMRWDLALILYLPIAIYLFTMPHSPRANIAAILFVLVFAYYCFGRLTVRYFTPLYFGRFSYGRLTRIGRLRGATFYYFLIVPSGTECRVNGFGFLFGNATIEQTYLLLQHPDDPSITRPIFDDNPRFIARTMELTRPDRWSQISEAVENLRGTRT